MNVLGRRGHHPCSGRRPGRTGWRRRRHPCGSARGRMPTLITCRTSGKSEKSMSPSSGIRPWRGEPWPRAGHPAAWTDISTWTVGTAWWEKINRNEEKKKVWRSFSQSMEVSSLIKGSLVRRHANGFWHQICWNETILKTFCSTIGLKCKLKLSRTRCFLSLAQMESIWV